MSEGPPPGDTRDAPVAVHGSDARLLLASRGLRGFVDGAVSVVLPSYLAALGFGPSRVGAIVTGTLLGSAALTLAVGLAGFRLRRRAVLLGASALMLATGIGFAGLHAYSALMVVAVAGTLNPSAGDVSVFLPTEQAVLAQAAAPLHRTATFAWYQLAGAFAGALGALASPVPGNVAVRLGFDPLAGFRAIFVVYALVALLVGLLYLRLSSGAEVPAGTAHAPLSRSRSIVLRMSAIFCVDSVGSGFVVQSLLALWLHQRFGLSLTTAGTFFFCAGLLGAGSRLLSSRLARRFGLIPTMVYTHLPSGLLLIAAGLAHTAGVALALLLARAAISQMDIAARQSFVMAVVPPEERAAAASVTNVPRSLASALPPLAAGAMLARSSFGWPLIVGGVVKVIYDILLLVTFRHVRADA